MAFREAKGGDFERADLDKIERFSGHFGSALRFRLAEEQTRAELAAVNFVLDELPEAIFLVKCHVRHANSAGRTMLGLGTPVRSNHCRLECVKPGLTEKLHRLILAGRGEIWLQKPDQGAWIIQVRCAAAASGDRHARGAIVRVLDQGRKGDELDAAMLAERLGLSARQAQSIVALVKCGREDVAAAQLGISKTTLHTHVLRAYDHLGVRRRAGLIALLAGQGFDVGLRNEKI